MGLSAAQEAAAAKIEAKFAEVNEAVAEIRKFVADSLAIRNVGGGHVINLTIALQDRLAGVDGLLQELRSAEGDS